MTVMTKMNVTYPVHASCHAEKTMIRTDDPDQQQTEKTENQPGKEFRSKKENIS